MYVRVARNCHRSVSRSLQLETSPSDTAHVAQKHRGSTPVLAWLHVIGTYTGTWILVFVLLKNGLQYKKMCAQESTGFLLYWSPRKSPRGLSETLQKLPGTLPKLPRHPAGFFRDSCETPLDSSQSSGPTFSLEFLPRFFSRRFSDVFWFFVFAFPGVPCVFFLVPEGAPRDSQQTSQTGIFLRPPAIPKRPNTKFQRPYTLPE